MIDAMDLSGPNPPAKSSGRPDFAPNFAWWQRAARVICKRRLTAPQSNTVLCERLAGRAAEIGVSFVQRRVATLCQGTSFHGGEVVPKVLEAFGAAEQRGEVGGVDQHDVT